jgi:hypothetical protein
VVRHGNHPRVDRLFACAETKHQCVSQVNYFTYIAMEVRSELARLGLRSLDELVGRADLLRPKNVKVAKTAGLDLSYITRFAGPVRKSSERIKQEVSLSPLGFALLECGVEHHCCTCALTLCCMWQDSRSLEVCLLLHARHGVTVLRQRPWISGRVSLE